MNTEEFLNAILPSDGVLFTAEWRAVEGHKRGGFYIHTPFTEIDAMCDHIAEVANRGGTIYHACASYKEVIYKEGKNGRQYPAGRTQDNVSKVKALWLDLDVKPDNPAAYASKKEAVQDVARFVRDVGFPQPLVVDSGNGVHIYWPFDKAVTRAEWLAAATSLRSVIEHVGVKHDRSRTCDCSSVLRPVGSFNFKRGEKKPVVGRTQATPVAYATLVAKLDAYVDKFNLDVPLPQFVGDTTLNSDLIVNREYPKSWAADISSRCNQVTEFKSTGGASEPVWYAVLGLLKHCEDGQELAHEWGAIHPDYDRDTTDAKMAQWSFGPPTCEKFKLDNPQGCAGCTRSCRSPIQLGHRESQNVPHTPIEVVVDTRAVDVVEFGPGSRYWPEGFSVTNGSVHYDAKSEEGEVKHIRLCTACWVVSEIESKGEYSIHMRAEIRKGLTHEFDIPMTALSSADKLRTALAANRVLVHDHSSKAGIKLMDLIIKQSTAIQRHREEIRTFTQMGWNNTKDRFLLGSTLFADTGRNTVRVAPDLAKLCKGANALVGGELHQRGSVEEYKNAVTTLYGRPDQAACRYVLGASIGAYVAPLVSDDTWHGIPLSVYSARSGYGKTTLVAIGLNAVAKHTQLMASDATLNGLKKILSAYGSVPVLFDELTGKLAAPMVSDLLYNWSQGIDRVRLRNDGSLLTGNEPWCNMGFVTSNKSVLFQLTESGTDPEACQVRVMEIDLSTHIPKPTKDTQELAIHTAANVYGVATDALMRTILRNQDKIREQLLHEFLTITDALPSRYATTSRFLVHHAACTVIGIKLGRNLGLWDFSAPEARKFAIDHITSQIAQVNDYRSTPEDRFASMLADLHGRLIITYRFNTTDGRTKLEEPLSVVPSHQSVAGRYAIGAPATKDAPADPGRLFITVSAINDWCESRRLNALEVRKDWVDVGLIEMRKDAGRLGEQKISLGKGIPTKGLGQARVVEFAIHKVRGVLPEVDIRPVESPPQESQPGFLTVR